MPFYELHTVKPPYFESRSFKSPEYLELYQKSRQKLCCIAAKIAWLFQVSKFRKFEHKCWSLLRLRKPDSVFWRVNFTEVSLFTKKNVP